MKKSILLSILLGILLLFAGCTKGNQQKTATIGGYGLEIIVEPTNETLYEGESLPFSVALENIGGSEATGIIVKPEHTSYARGTITLERLEVEGSYEDTESITISAPQKLDVSKSIDFDISVYYNYSTKASVDFCLRNVTFKRELERGACTPIQKLRVNQTEAPVKIIGASENIIRSITPKIELVFKIKNVGSGEIATEETDKIGRIQKFVLANLTLNYGGIDIMNINKYCNESYINRETKVRGKMKLLDNGLLKSYIASDGVAYIRCKLDLNDIAKEISNKMDVPLEDLKENLKEGIKDASINIYLFYRYKSSKKVYITFEPLE